MKPAHKTLMSILAMLAVALFAACSSDSADSDDDFAGTVWSYSYGYYEKDDDSGDYKECSGITMLYFQSGGNVAVFYNENDKNTGAENGTYNVSGSTVTLNLDDSGTIVLTSSSGKLIYNTTLILTTTSKDLDDTINAGDLADTTWTYEYDDGDSYKLVFGDANNVTVTFTDTDSKGYTDYGTYSVDGTTVTVDYEDRQTTFIYSDGKLVFVWVFTYDGTI